jgi:hypothetical protein
MGAILSALAALPSILGYVNQFCQAVLVWYIQRQDTIALSAIQDALAAQTKAVTQGDRFAAADAWQVAFSKPRTTID